MNSDPYLVLRNRDLTLLLSGKFFITLASQMQAVIVGWQVYQLTKDPLALGLVGLAEALSFIGFALWAGHVADRGEKRVLILISQVGLLGGSLALWGLTLTSTIKAWLIYGVIGLTGIARSFLWSASSTYLQQIVPIPLFNRAAAWNSSIWEIGAILGPALGGVIYAWSGASGAYGGVVLFLGVGIILSISLKKVFPVPPATTDPVRSSFLSGLQFVFSNQILLAALTLDMFAVLFGGVVAILPIFADMLHVGPSGLGLLRAAPAVGAIFMALYQAHRPPFQRTGITLLSAVALFGFFTILFGISTHFWLSMVLLAASGMADNVSVVIRHSIVQAMTPDSMRGRVSSVNGIFIGSSNEIGAFESGLAARLMGTVPSVVFGGSMTLATVALTVWKAPRLVRLKSVERLNIK